MGMNAIARKLEAIEQKGAVRSVDVANILGIRPETVSRWNQGKAFPRPNAERQLLELEFVIDELSDLYEPQEARMWLFSPQKRLGGSKPVDLISQGRIEEVRAAINQVRDGVYL